MSSRRRSVSGSAVRVVKRKLSPPATPTLTVEQDSLQQRDIPEIVLGSPVNPSKRRLSAIGGAAARVRTPSKTPSKKSEGELNTQAINTVFFQEKENSRENANHASVFLFCADTSKRDENFSDDYSRDSLDSQGTHGSESTRRSSVSSHDSTSSTGGIDDTNRTWCSKDFSIVRAIGKGKFGNVYMAKVKKCRTTVALKVLFKAPMRAANCVHSLRREVEIQCRLKHKNITQLFGYFHDSKNVYLILEYHQQGELFKYIDKLGGKVDELTCKGFIKDVASALSYLHSNNVAHRDLKPENVLFDYEENGRMNLRIADFGCAVILPSDSNSKDGCQAKQLTVCGTPEYLAPEMLHECGHGLAVDLWAMGIFIFDLIVGKTPFVGDTCIETRNGDVDNLGTYDRIKRHEGALFPHVDPAIDKLFSDQAKDVINQFLNPQPDQRVSAELFLEMPWIKN